MLRIPNVLFLSSSTLFFWASTSFLAFLAFLHCPFLWFAPLPTNFFCGDAIYVEVVPLQKRSGGPDWEMISINSTHHTSGCAFNTDSLAMWGLQVYHLDVRWSVPEGHWSSLFFPGSLLSESMYFLQEVSKMMCSGHTILPFKTRYTCPTFFFDF